MFPCMIAGASTLDVISSGMNGTRSGSLQVVYMFLHCVNFLNFAI